MFLMIGDNIYGDTEDMDVLREKIPANSARSLVFSDSAPRVLS